MRRWFARLGLVGTMGLFAYGMTNAGLMGLWYLVAGAWLFVTYALTDEFTKGFGEPDGR